MKLDQAARFSKDATAMAQMERTGRVGMSTRNDGVRLAG